MDLRRDALELLKETSRTFYIPIMRLPRGLQEAVASAYLCMRAIDEVEDHPTLENAVKIELLQKISLVLQAGVDGFAVDAFAETFAGYEEILPEVTIRIREWAILAPETIAPRIWDATAAMSDRMAYWANRNWQIDNESDLDRYTFGVAGAVGLLLSDLWNWFDGTQTNRTLAIGFGRGLQAVNILRNHNEDYTQRGVSFFPNGWDTEMMITYANRNLALADAYNAALGNSPALDFCIIPLTLAHGTLNAIAQGKEKLTRTEVIYLLEQVAGININAG